MSENKLCLKCGLDYDVCENCGNCWDWKVGGECEAAKRGDEHDVIFKKIEQ